MKIHFETLRKIRWAFNVSDGIAGRHPPFAKQFIEALEKGMGVMVF